MQSTKQICDYALHKFLEKVEEAVIAGYRTHKTPTSFAKSIGGRYVVTMVKAIDEGLIGGEFDSNLKTTELPAFSHEHTMKLPPVKPTTRKSTKKAGDESES